MKVKILAIGVHPDDIELGCSGTLLHHIQQGDDVGLLDLTLGELGSRGNKDIRTLEAMYAAKKMNAKFRIQLDLGDGFFKHNHTSLTQIIGVIRYCQPDVVLANAISDRHPDHGRAAKLVADACYLSGLPKIKTTYQSEKQDAWRPQKVLHYIQDYLIKPDIVMDISDTIFDKLNLVLTFKSQFYDPESSEPQTPISTDSFMEYIKAKARVMGRPAGFEFGEGFTADRYLGIKNLDHII